MNCKQRLGITSRKAPLRIVQSASIVLLQMLIRGHPHAAVIHQTGPLHAENDHELSVQLLLIAGVL